MTALALFELLTLDCRVNEYGTVCYYNSNGRLHRVHGPATVRTDGFCAWYQDGLRHRLDGPAVDWPDVGRAWYQNGQRHRLEGPAVMYNDGTYEWWLNGIEHTQAEWHQVVTSMGITND